jgi:cell wall-associated NlpC family hydrolase
MASASLQGVIKSPRFVKGTGRQIVWPIAPLRRNPVAAAGLDTELLFGETVTVYDEAEGWSWVQADLDRYVGYVPSGALHTKSPAASHSVSATGTFVYPVPDIKAPPLMHLSLGSRLKVEDRDERFSRLASGGYVINRHITETGRHVRDFVEIAERFIGTPYLWGGRTRIGLDCSGLLQICLQAAGQVAPRDSDMQETQLGLRIKTKDGLDGLERGDLVFWKGHVGIMLDGVMMIHANAHHMAVSVEPLHEASARIGRSGSQITSIKRLGKTKTVRTT